jgi:hypothetical protein
VLAKKKRTREVREAEEALAVARAVDHAERGGRGSGILIGDSRTRVPLTDRVLGTEATKEAKDQPEEQEQPSPPRRCSGHTTLSQVTPAAALERPRRGGHPAPCNTLGVIVTKNLSCHHLHCKSSMIRLTMLCIS